MNFPGFQLQRGNVSVNMELDAVVRYFEAIASSSPTDPVRLYNQVFGGMYLASAAIAQAEVFGHTQEAIASEMAPVRSLHSLSPFVSRLQTWPRGLPGDFETIEQLCDGINSCEMGTVEWAIEQCALNSPAAQQHRNKLAWQEQAIRDVVGRVPQARILSLASGGSRDLRAALPALIDRAATVTVNDIDQDAANLSQDRLAGLGSALSVVPGDVFRAIRSMKSGWPFDLVVAGGLFDYLSERHAVHLLSQIRRLLRPGGMVCFTNMALPHLFRPWMEYIASWRVIPRHERDLSDLLTAGGFELARAKIRRDQSGLTYLISAMEAATAGGGEVGGILVTESGDEPAGRTNDAKEMNGIRECADVRNAP